MKRDQCQRDCVKIHKHVSLDDRLTLGGSGELTVVRGHGSEARGSYLHIKVEDHRGNTTIAILSGPAKLRKLVKAIQETLSQRGKES